MVFQAAPLARNSRLPAKVFFMMGWLLLPLVSWGQERTQVYLTVEEAPKVIFPEADRWERKEIKVTPALSQRLKQLVGRAKPTIWEPFYISFLASKGRSRPDLVSCWKGGPYLPPDREEEEKR